MTPLEWLVLALGVGAIAMVLWWFLGHWPGHKVGNDGHHH